MEALPEELLVYIFSFLKFEHFLPLSEVCRQFHVIINSKKFLRQVCVKVDVTRIREIRSDRNYLRIKLCDGGSTNSIIIDNHEISMFTSARKLTLIEMVISSDHIELTNKFNFINTLHLEGLKLQSSCVKFFKLPHLICLKFLYCSNSLLKLLTNVSAKLSTFKVCLLNEEDSSECCNALYEIIEKNSKFLKKLHLYEKYYDRDFIEKLSKLNSLKLESLSMGFCNLAEVDPFANFMKSQATSLQKFKIRAFDFIDEDKLFIIVQNLQNIRKLSLTLSPFDSYNKIYNFTYLCKLHCLKIATADYCSRDRRFARILLEKVFSQNLNMLRHLTIVGQLEFSDEIVSALVERCNNLQFLELINANGILTKHIYILKDKITSLQRIKFISCEFDDNFKLTNI
jgi:F-box-like